MQYIIKYYILYIVYLSKFMSYNMIDYGRGIKYNKLPFS
jgi:hypothetical protein